MGDKETEVTAEDREIKKRTGDIYKKQREEARYNVKEGTSRKELN